MRFCCNVSENLEVISITMIFLKNKYSFKLDLYFMGYMHANTKNKERAFKNFLIFDLFV